MSNIMDTIANETNGKSFKTFKYSFDGLAVPTFDYDDNRQITWEKSGETSPSKISVNMDNYAKKIANEKPLFTYFLDGSRRTFKVMILHIKIKFTLLLQVRLVLAAA